MTDTRTSGTTAADAGHGAAENAAAGQGDRPAKRGIGLVGWLRWSWRQLTSMRTALVLLFLVALAVIPGSFFPQRGQAPEKVAAYIKEHEKLAPVLDRLSLFDVFSAPWFAAIYILLFVSLAGCVLPRSWRHLRNATARPPAAPRNLARLPQSASYETGATPQEALEQARALLRRRRFRVDVGGDHGGEDASRGGWVAAEKGHLGETGNLVFHLALLVLLFAVAVGGMFGYKGNMLITEGDTFANTLTRYDSFTPGRRFATDDLPPFSFTLDDFRATYITKGVNRGQPTDFFAALRYRESQSGPERRYELRVNHPLNVDGTKVYLLGHGYAPTFTVRDGEGNVAFKGAVPFLPLEERTFTSQGVVKVPDARPSQLGLFGVFWPTAVPDENGKASSAFPAALNPVVSIVAFKGDLGLGSGTPQSVYQLEGIGKTLTRVPTENRPLQIGQTLKLPDGLGTVEFTGYKEWISLAVNDDPGRVPALTAAVVAILGIVTSFLVRRRRVWVRVGAVSEGRTVVEVGGLTLGGATTEFDDIVAALRGPGADPPDGPAADAGGRTGTGRPGTDRPDRTDQTGPAGRPGEVE